jgi:hypothetical protein
MCVSSVEILNYLKRNIGIIIKLLEETGVLVDIESIPNPSNLDVALSTRASESTLSSFAGTPDSSPPSKGVVLLGYDGTYVRRLRVDSTGRLLLVLG